MRQAWLGVLGTVVVLELVTAGGLKAGQNQAGVGDLSGAGVIGAAGPEGSSVGPRNLYTLPFPHSSSGTVGEAGAGAGLRNQLDELSRSTNRRSSLLIGLYILHGALQALDAQATLRALHTGSAREGNPIIRPFASQPAALVTFKLGLGAGTIYGIDRLHKSHSRLATSALGVINAGYVYIVQRNYRSFPGR
jgi:hypothetical protein